MKNGLKSYIFSQRMTVIAVVAICWIVFSAVFINPVWADPDDPISKEAVIMDISVDQGGNCEITEQGRFYKKSGVNVCGIQNIPGRMAVHASWLYANNMYCYVENLFKNGEKELDLEDEIVKSSLVTHQSIIHHEGALKAMQRT